MALITFLSDFGYTDHYVAAVKASILKNYPQAQVLDISHAIEPFNILHGLYVLNAVYRDFPAGTVHLLAVDSQGAEGGRYHALQFNQHYFLAPDNGILSLLTESRPEKLVQLDSAGKLAHPAKEILAPAAAFLVQGGDILALGPETKVMRELINRQLRFSDHAITGHIIHIDHYGNLITDISRDSIDAIGHGRQFTIKFARETVDKIYAQYNAVDEGDCVCVFTTQNLLSIGINKGNASELLGLHFDSRVDINFYPATPL